MNRRNSHKNIDDEVFDIAIIGGGITGAGILKEASEKGYKCILIDKNDFAGGTSSKSAKLIHGGLRYLQYAQFGLVKKALQERNYLLNEYPHLVKPLAFLFVVDKLVFKYRIGMMIYQWLGTGKNLPSYKFLTRKKIKQVFPFIDLNQKKGGFVYFDAITHDARLCNEIIYQAEKIFQSVGLNYFELKSVTKGKSCTVLNCYDKIEEKKRHIKTKCIVNASGPWIDDVLGKMECEKSKITAPSKGVHIVLPQKRLPAKMAMTFKNEEKDGGVYYIIPWENDTVIVGVTDTEYTGNLDQIDINDQDVNYLLQGIQRFAPKLNITQEDIIFTYAGIRPLINDKKNTRKRTRDYKIWWSGDYVINIFGGKLTNFHAMGTSLVKELEKKKITKSLLKRPTNGITTKCTNQIENKIAKKIHEKYGPETEIILSILQEDPAFQERIHHDFDIFMGEAIYFIRNQNCYFLDDLLYRRLALGYAINHHEDKEHIKNKLKGLFVIEIRG